MKPALFFIVLALCIPLLNAQKRVKKALIEANRQYVQIDTKNCFKVNLITTKSKEIEVKAFIEGEYQKDLALNIEQVGNNVLVSAGFLPNFIQPNDKLSAHKVVSISLEISLPEYLNVTVYGTNSFVTATGNYRYLKVTLADGDCTLNNVTEKAAIKTQKGNILVRTKVGSIEAQSIYGKVVLADIPDGNQRYTLNSVEGNIQINKTE